MKKVKAGEIRFSHPVWKKISSNAKDFIMSLLTPDPKKRPSAAQALKHPWIRERFALQEKVNQDAAELALINMKEFNAGSRLVQATYAFIAS